jgi:transcription elongation factor GreA
MAKEFKLSRARLAELEQELHYLKTTRELEVAEHLKEARSFGDLSENSEYDEAKSDQAKLEARILEIEYTLSHATVLDESTLSTEKVYTGLSVRIYDETYDEEVVYQLVGAPQADPMHNKVSDESPVGKELLGHKVGDVITVETPMGNDVIKILEIFKP